MELQLDSATAPIIDASAPRPAFRPLAPIRDFLATETAGGALLLAATVIALLWANSPWKESYATFWSTEFSLAIGGFGIEMNLAHVVSEGLMTIFFLVVGLEIKREATSGHLSTGRAMALPVIAAIGGMVVPAAIYLSIAGSTAAHGWGVPIATDIALAVGLLSTFGSRVPTGARVFLLGLAVADDIGGIVVIAIFYTAGMSGPWLGFALAGFLLALVLRRAGVESVVPFVIAGAILWYGLYQSGVHPTIAGVLMGLLTPITPKHHTDYVDVEDVDAGRSGAGSVSVVEWLEHALHPWSSFVIVPLFALSAAGITIDGESVSAAVRSPIAWGILLGLVIGKPAGALLATLASNRAGITESPKGTDLRTMLGAGHAAGIGFTVALFISELAFDDPLQHEEAAMAILVASLLSAILASAVIGLRRKRPDEILAAASAN